MRGGKAGPVLVFLALAATALPALAGCGGGSGSTSAAGGSFATDADAACARANQRIAALGTPRQGEVLAYLERTEAVIERLHRQVAALGASGAAETAYTEALARALPVLNEMANAARSENFDAVRELSDELVKLRLGERAEAAGLETCAEVPVSES